jgi:hypothetical protein
MRAYRTKGKEKVRRVSARYMEVEKLVKEDD